MSDVVVSDPARALGLPHEYTAPDGRKVAVGRWTLAVTAAYGKYLRDRAVEAVRDMRDLLTPEEYRDQLAHVARDYVTGAYGFGGAVCSDSMQSRDNIAHLCHLQCGLPISEARALVEADPGGVLDAMVEANVDPTKPPASTSQAGPAGQPAA